MSKGLRVAISERFLGELIEENRKLREALKKCKEYIEEKEEVIDSEWGSCRGLSELIKYGEMPELYDEIIKLIGGEGE